MSASDIPRRVRPLTARIPQAKRKNESGASSPDVARNNNDPSQLLLRCLRSRRLSIPVGSDGPTCKRLISRTFLPHERISLIEAIFTSQDEINAIGRLSGDDIQAFIDAIHKVRFHICSFLRRAGLIAFVGLFSPLSPSTDQALDLPDLTPRLWRRCLSALCRICGRQALLPKSLQITFYYDRLDIPLYKGGFADVWMGEYQGRKVAVKVLRVCRTSNFDKITGVGCLHSSLTLRTDELTDWCRGSARKLLCGKHFAIQMCCRCWEWR